MDSISETARWIVGGALTALLGAFAWLTNTNNAGRAKLHERLDEHIQSDAAAHQKFATRDDLRDDIASLRAHIDSRFSELTQLVTRGK
jgi:low affinity Fe/Cu permease